MTYEEALIYLQGRTSFGIKPGLERIEALLKELGNPEKSYKTIHITGTNGKGSVTAFLANTLSVSGIRTGRFTSPHLNSYTERMRINDQDIKETDFGEIISKVAAKAKVIEERGVEAPTEFEILTAAAFLFFEEQEVEYAVVEVGLGGLLDSTNVITPEVSVITNVSIDHQSYSGETIEEIAVHKSGIIKKGVPVVTAAQGNALKIIREKAHACKAKIYSWGKEFFAVSRSVMKTGQIVTVETPDKMQAMLFTGMAGLHQAVNLSCAYMVLKLLLKQDDRISEETIREGLARTTWPGRFETFFVLGRTVILDGAHNVGGAEAFEATYRELYKDKSKTLVFSILEDKDLSGIATYLMGPRDRVIVVPAPTSRSCDPKEVVKKLPCQAVAKESVSEGIEEAFKETEEGDIIAVCGSLYILGEAKMKLVDMDK